MPCEKGWWKVALVPLVLSLGGCTCNPEEKSASSEASTITVVRVESASPEQPGAEHCDEQGKNCRPLAPQQKIEPQGIVRTFFGGKVSLDYGDGRRVDLGSNSETALTRDKVDLKAGDFSLSSTPLVEKEPVPALKFSVAGKSLSTDPSMATTSSISVDSDQSLVTVRSGNLTGLFPADHSGPQAGQSVRLAKSQLFWTGPGGQELLPLPPVVPPIGEFGGLLAERKHGPTRGLGTMTARLPNTDQVRDGVNLAKHLVKVTIYDGYARTEVEEEFENTSAHILEGRYRFPIPADASLSRLALWVGDTLVEGEVLEKGRAASIYKSIVDRPVPRDPALLEWMTGGEMSLKVFPILPKKSRRVVLAYNQALSTEGGMLRYVYPLSLGEGRKTNVRDLSISLHIADSRAELEGPRVFGYEAKVGREGRYFTANVSLKDVAPQDDFVFSIRRNVRQEAQISTYVPSWKTEPSAIADASKPLGGSSGGAFGHFALRLSADLPEGFVRPTPLRHDRAIVIDVSQSQSKETILAQGALAYAMIRDLDPDEGYVILACDSACSAFPSEGLKRPSFGHLEQARDHLMGLTTGGSSDVAGALATGARYLTRHSTGAERRRQLVFMTDGQPSAGELSAETIASVVQPLLADIDLRFVAAGRTLDEDTLRGLTTRLGATWDKLEATGPLEVRLLEMAISLRQPVLKNVQVSLPPHLHSTDVADWKSLRLGQEMRLTGTLASANPGSITITGTLEGAPYRKTLPLEIADRAENQNPLVPRLWARSEIGRLQELEATPDVVAAIVGLSREHRTLSRHTSFLVLENEKMYEDFGVERTSVSKDDQPDSSFSDLRLELKGESDDYEPSSVSSFEALEEGGASRRAESADAAPPRSAAKPMPAPAPAPAPAPKASASADDALGRTGLGTSGGSASQSASGGLGSSGQSAPAGPREDAWTERERRQEVPLDFPIFDEPRHIRRPYRAYLNFARADDAWRGWGQKNLTELEERLAADPESRARLEAYILGAIQSGRFEVARKKATDFVEIDPDYAPARQLLAYASVVDGDHETARKMLDIHVERAPTSPTAHLESARAFDVVGDTMRACAHYRSLAELTPDVAEAAKRARECWDFLTGRALAVPASTTDGEKGQLQIEVLCDPGIGPNDCPSPIAIAPDGRVLSPWTPGSGDSSRQRVTFVKLRTGDYHVLITGGAPSARGKVVLTGRHESEALSFSRGGMHTIGRASVSFH